MGDSRLRQQSETRDNVLISLVLLVAVAATGGAVIFINWLVKGTEAQNSEASGRISIYTSVARDCPPFACLASCALRQARGRSCKLAFRVQLPIAPSLPMLAL